MSCVARIPKPKSNRDADLFRAEFRGISSGGFSAGGFCVRISEGSIILRFIGLSSFGIRYEHILLAAGLAIFVLYVRI
jgi:hypothetical protein